MYSNSEWTNNEASRTKLSLSQLGYFNDDFVKYFCGTPLKRTPEINRGYFSRVYSIAHFVQQFCLREGARAQIVNIGAGFDTLFWRLQVDPKIKFARFVDVDCNEVVEHKIRAIKNCAELHKHCYNISSNTTLSNFNSDNYHVIAQDATKSLRLVDKLLNNCKINKSDPILFIFECVLLYWEEEASTNLIFSLNKSFEKCNFVVFDLVNTGDKFSHLMQKSLYDHDTPLLGAPSVRTLDDWNRKFTQNGSIHVKSWMMTQVYDKLMDKNEKARIEKIEFLDELELLTQLFNHYCIVFASKYQQYDWNC